MELTRNLEIAFGRGNTAGAPTSQKRVLHVVESYGGGVASAVDEYAKSLYDVEHHLMRAVREGDYVSDSSARVFTSEQGLSRNPWSAVRQIRRAIQITNPDVIHAHSSFAGIFARLAHLGRATAVPLVYTPHGFAFERRDQNGTQRLAYWAAEWLQSWNTATVAGCSERETYLASKLRAHRAPVYVPNIVGDSVRADSIRRLKSNAPHELVIVGQGRLGPARDPAFFLRVIDEIRCAGIEPRVIWVGGGTKGWEIAFRNAGIEVTGWKSREEALALIADSDLYLHTAAWDGFPMALLEAQAVGTPALARRIPALASAPESLVFDTPTELAEAARGLVQSVGARDDVDLAWATYLAGNTRENQRGQLIKAYGW